MLPPGEGRHIYWTNKGHIRIPDHPPTPSSLLTSVVFTAGTGEASLSASTHATVQTGVGVTQVDLRFTVIAGEADWAAAAEACDGMDGTKQNGGRGNEGGRAVEAQHRDTLHVVLARLSETHIVVERENLQRWERREGEKVSENLFNQQSVEHTANKAGSP